jgi:CheY-like chemotaxis protein
MSTHSTSPTATPEPVSDPTATKRVVLVADLDSQWAGIVRALEFDHIEFDILAPRTRQEEVVACATRSESVVVVDLDGDPGGAMGTVTACRRAAGTVPVIAVAGSPSLDLTRSVRLSGAFYLALQPVGVDEMRSILQSAFACLERRRASASTCRATRRVLIIDDDPDFIASTAALLEAHGYAVSRAQNGREGLDRMLAEHPDLLIVDVMMEHEWAGYEVNQAIKFGSGFECVRHIPIVMVSAIPVGPATRFSAAGEVAMVTPNVYLTKPLDIPRFLAEVSALLGEPRTAAAQVRS